MESELMLGDTCFVIIKNQKFLKRLHSSVFPQRKGFQSPNYFVDSIKASKPQKWWLWSLSLKELIDNRTQRYGSGEKGQQRHESVTGNQRQAKGR